MRRDTEKRVSTNIKMRIARAKDLRYRHAWQPLTILIFAFTLLVLSACESAPPAPSTQAPTEISDPTPVYKDLAQPVSARVEDLLGRMTLEEKIGQMTQVEKDSIEPGDVTAYFIGSILSGGGGSPEENSVDGWVKMTNSFQEEAIATRLDIPLIYGVDAVHGHGNLFGATIFPHQVGLGATRNPELVRQIGEATAKEIRATGIHWNFAPVLAVPQDIRWGRTYESFGENTELVNELGLAYMEGLQTLPDGFVAAAGQTLYSLATPKHYLGDGGTVFGSSSESTYLLDQGDMRLDESGIRELFLPPYQEAVDHGALSIMPSYSSWNGTKMHAQTYWLTDVLKDELGFSGLVISDWGAIDQIDFDYYIAVVTAINAGVDMNMVPTNYTTFINTMKKAVENGDISISRIDDAVRRILTVKFALGLFDQPFQDSEQLAAVGSDAHRSLARQAVRESLVLLINENNALPIAKDTPLIYVAGQGADDIGLQSGGWTITWQGTVGEIQPGTTILEGIQAAVASGSEVQFKPDGLFEGMADVGIAVVGEFPYAEGVGDKRDLALSIKDIEVIKNIHEHSEKSITIILSGRPLILTDQYSEADSWVAAWLPGTEGAGVADVLFGDYPFTGKLPFTWPRSMEQLPIDFGNLPSEGCEAPLFPFGYGLDTESLETPIWQECN